jgi:hypothetical protein
MRSIEEQKKRRRTNFLRWWKNNNKHVKAHEWLVRTSRDMAYKYNLHPNAFSMVQEISKRFLHSTYKRLQMEEAWFLWKHTHLLMDERIERLQKTGDYYKEQHDKFKYKKHVESVQKESKTEVVVEKKRKKVFKK